jgi:hypothetical protein
MPVSLEDGNYVNPCLAFGISYYLWTILIPGLFATGLTLLNDIYTLNRLDCII